MSLKNSNWDIIQFLVCLLYFVSFIIMQEIAPQYSGVLHGKYFLLADGFNSWNLNNMQLTFDALASLVSLI